MIFITQITTLESGLGLTPFTCEPLGKEVLVEERLQKNSLQVFIPRPDVWRYASFAEGSTPESADAHIGGIPPRVPGSNA